MVAFILIWILYKSNEDIKNLKIASERTIGYMTEVHEGNIEYYEDQIKRYATVINNDVDLIDELREENWKLKYNRW